MGTEFKQLEARLSPLGEAFAALEAGAARPDLDVHAVAAWLARAAEVEAEMRHVEARCSVFHARALETDPDKKVYGTSMCERVLQACRQANHLVERWVGIEAARDRLRAAQAEQSAAAAAAAAADEQMRTAQEEAAAATRAAAAAEEAARRQREDEAQAHEHVAAAKAAAARVLASAAPVFAPVAPSDADVAVTAARRAYDGPGLGVAQALERVRVEATTDAYGDVVQVACLLLSNVHKFPEERGFSTLRLRNQLIHRHVAARHGGFELLRALGFALRDADSEEPLLLLEEPDVQQQYEEWAAWYERLKANIAMLEAELRALRIAVLPTAVKGGQYGVDLPSSGRRNGPQVATLHGSSGGTT